jgi:hypothetical protein
MSLEWPVFKTNRREFTLKITTLVLKPKDSTLLTQEPTTGLCPEPF